MFYLSVYLATYLSAYLSISIYLSLYMYNCHIATSQMWVFFAIHHTEGKWRFCIFNKFQASEMAFFLVNFCLKKPTKTAKMTNF